MSGSRKTRQPKQATTDHRPVRRGPRHVGAAAVGLAGLAMVVLSPAAVAWGWQAYEARGDDRPAHWRSLGTEVHDGPVTFVVHTVRCGTVQPPEAVHGRLCELTIGARNDGPEPVTVPGSAQQLAGPEGARHLPLPEQTEPFGTIGPGAAATATLTFDLPADVRITHIRLHADPYTNGQAVGLDSPPLPLLSVNDRGR